MVPRFYNTLTMSRIPYEKFWNQKSENYVDMDRSDSSSTRSKHPSDDYVYAENIWATQPDEKEKAKTDQDATVHPHRSEGLMLEQTKTVTVPNTGLIEVTNGSENSHTGTQTSPASGINTGCGTSWA